MVMAVMRVRQHSTRSIGDPVEEVKRIAGRMSAIFSMASINISNAMKVRSSSG